MNENQKNVRSCLRIVLFNQRTTNWESKIRLKKDPPACLNSNHFKVVLRRILKISIHPSIEDSCSTFWHSNSILLWRCKRMTVIKILKNNSVKLPFSKCISWLPTLEENIKSNCTRVSKYLIKLRSRNYVRIWFFTCWNEFSLPRVRLSEGVMLHYEAEKCNFFVLHKMECASSKSANMILHK